MKLLVGLGNPGEKYRRNRHNVGFMMVDFIVEQIQNSEFRMDKKTESEICEIEINNEKIILAKPQTFMNESGRGVKKIISNFTLPAGRQEFSISNDLIVIHDDLDIRLGEFKIQKGKGPKQHNGIDSIEESLQTKDFWRVRIGVDNRSPENKIPGEVYTLQNFTGEEKKVLEKVFSRIDLINLIPNLPKQ